MKKGEAIKPYRLFVSGPGGVGKSYVISQRHSKAVAPLKTSGTRRCLTANSTYRSRSFQHQGMTIHSALLLGTSKVSSQPLTQDKLNTENKAIQSATSNY